MASICCFGLIIGKYMKDHNLESQIDYVSSNLYWKNTLFSYMLHIIPVSYGQVISKLFIIIKLLFYYIKYNVVII